MPVRKFRSVAHMPDTGSLPPGDPRLPRVLEQVWAFTARCALTRPRRGVTKFRTIEELTQHRETWPRRQ